MIDRPRLAKSRFLLTFVAVSLSARFRPHELPARRQAADERVMIINALAASIKVY